MTNITATSLSSPTPNLQCTQFAVTVCVEAEGSEIHFQIKTSHAISAVFLRQGFRKDRFNLKQVKIKKSEWIVLMTMDYFILNEKC